MKTANSIKDVLKPPFYDNGIYIFDSNTHRVLDIRGWGLFGYFENSMYIQNEFKEFVVQAMNEKWERDYRGRNEADII